MPLKINPATSDLDLVLNPGGGVSATTFAGDSGTATPTIAGLITLTGGTGLTTSASGNAVTFAIDTPVSVANGGTGVSTLTDGGVVIGSGTGAVTVLGQATDGQLVIGSTGADPVLATLTAGAGMTITEGAGSITLASSGVAALSFPTDSGTATPAANALTVAGGTGISTSGAGSTVTVTLDTPVSVANGGTGASTLTDGGVILGSGAGAVTVLSQATDGQLVIGSTGADPVLATLTAGTGITITDAAGSITVAGTAAVPISFPTDSGTATPAANALTVTGGTGVNTSGAGAVVTVNIDSPVLVANGGTGATTLTDGGVLLGSGVGAVTVLAQATDGQLVIGSTGTDPAVASLTAPAAGLTITGGAGTITFALADDLAALEGLSGTGVVARTAADTYAERTITGTSPIVVADGDGVAGNPTISVTGGGLPWAVETGTTRALVVNEGVIGNNGTGITMTLPTTAAVGSVIKITNMGAGLVGIAQNAGESINVVGSTTTVGVGGSLTATEQFDSIELVCVVADTTWTALSLTGNWTIV